jgi:pro-apoptotic serine protease NMA111
VAVQVEDLHSITPSDFLMISSGVVHPLSYNHAKNFNLPVGGVYMAASGYMFTRYCR